MKPIRENNKKCIAEAQLSHKGIHNYVFTILTFSRKRKKHKRVKFWWHFQIQAKFKTDDVTIFVSLEMTGSDGRSWCRARRAKLEGLALEIEAKRVRSRGRTVFAVTVSARSVNRVCMCVRLWEREIGSVMWAMGSGSNPTTVFGLGPHVVSKAKLFKTKNCEVRLGPHLLVNHLQIFSIF